MGSPSSDGFVRKRGEQNRERLVDETVAENVDHLLHADGIFSVILPDGRILRRIPNCDGKSGVELERIVDDVVREDLLDGRPSLERME